MSDTHILPPLSPAAARQIDQACDRFEAAWKAGQRPDPAEYLGTAAGFVRSALLRQLLLLDWDYRRRAGDDPRPGDYQARFPNDSAVIEDVRREMTGAAVSTCAEPGELDTPDTPWPGDPASWTGEGDPGVAAGAARYDLLEEVGQGGIGVVFRGRDRLLGRDLAVKVLRDAYRDRPDARRRFLTEARVGSQLQHPAIVPVYELGRFDDGRPYLTMKLVQGHTLAALLHDRANPSQDLPRLFSVFEQVCQAIAYAHSRGVVHRDLKPANIMVGAFGEVQVMDWGFAKVLVNGTTPPEESMAGPVQARPIDDQSRKSQSGALMGTPAYMPPEQARGEVALIDSRADVFALGAILCEILTGKPPYSADTAADVCQLAAAGNLEDANARLDACGADGALRDLARRCLAIDRQSRPPDAGVVARDVAAYLASSQERLRRAEIERAAAEASATEAQAKVKSERRVRRLMLALAAALLLGAAGATWQAVVANGAKRDAQEAAAAETKAKETAQTKEAETATVLDFVENHIFVAARPEGRPGGLGSDVTLRRALEAALPVVETSFAQQPLVEARLRMTLGLSFRYLGEAQIAADQFTRARAIYTDLLGPNDPATLESMRNLANTYADLGHFNDAFQLRRQTLTLRRASLGPDHPDTLKSMYDLANSLAQLGHFDDALRLDEETLALRKTKLGPDHPDTLLSMNNVAVDYMQAGRSEEAAALRETILALMKAKFGREHPDTLLCMLNLANSYGRLHKYPEALKLFQDALAVQRVKLPADHPDTLNTMYFMAITYGDSGQRAKAVEVQRDTLARREAKLGPNHPDTLLSMWGVAANLVLGGHGAEAIPVIDECLKRAVGTTVDPRLFSGVTNLRMLHFEKVQDAASCRATAEMFEKLNRTSADDLYEAARFRAIVARVVRATGRSSDAARQADAELDRAMSWLQQAVAAGYKDVSKMQQSKDLEALHERAEYQKLVAGLKARE